MRLSDLEKYDPITIQCHDNPDADAIASAFGLYCFFMVKGKQVSMFYSGRNEISKPNMLLMIKELQIPIEYRKTPCKIDGLLITVDCQYGSGNVTKFEADEIAIIDHHQEEDQGTVLKNVMAGVGSCSSIVWKMLLWEEFPMDNIRMTTALFYGLYMDTGQLAEVFHPWDKDLRDDIPYNKEWISLFRRSNMTLQELSLASVAMLRYIHNEKYRYAIVKADSCDPNILGMISDILVQVDEIHTTIVYNHTDDGYKFSVRSCTKEVRASELAAYVAGELGSGGGHADKAGGFISLAKYEKKYGGLHTEAYFSEKMQKYFEESKIIYTKDYEIDTSDMKLYIKKKIPMGYMIPSKILELETPITIRTMEGDVETVVSKDLCIMIGIRGDVYPNTITNLKNNYNLMTDPYEVIAEYKPVIKNRKNGETLEIAEHAMCCIPKGKDPIWAKELDHRLKIFTGWDESGYMLGEVGDFIAVRTDNRKDIYVVERETFFASYDEAVNHSGIE